MCFVRCVVFLLGLPNIEGSFLRIGNRWRVGRLVVDGSLRRRELKAWE